MIILHWFDIEYTAHKAIRGNDYVILYDENNNETQRIEGIYGKTWDHIFIEGEWSYPEDIPTETETLRADVDFLTMENEFLESENAELRAQGEIDRADIDYCLMLLEE